MLFLFVVESHLVVWVVVAVVVELIDGNVDGACYIYIYEPKQTHTHYRLIRLYS